MTQTKPHPADAAPAPAGWFERIGLAVLLTLIPLRAVVNEHLSFEMPRLFRHVGGAGDAHPGTTMLFSIVIIAVAIAHRLYRLLARPDIRFRATGAEIGLALLTVCGAAATVAAGQKHLALFGAVNFLALVLYAVTLTQFLTSPWRLRLTILVILATAVVVLAKGALQHFYEIPETIAYYEAHHDELMGAGPAAATGMVHDYEQRMRSRLIGAYYPHANVLASHLIVFFSAALALIADRLARGTARTALVAPGLIAAGCVVAMLGTDSKGGLAALAAVIPMTVAARVARAWVARHPRGTAVAVWGAGLVGVLAVVAVLHVNEAALGRSIQFRHMYWRGAAAIVAQHPLAGVGPANFGRHFTRHKPVECPEDVDSPHSWPVELAAEWGLPGLGAFVAVLVGITVTLVRPGASPPVAEAPGSVVRWPLALMPGIFGYWLMQLAGADRFIIAGAMLFGTIPWLVGFIVTALEDRRDSTVSDSPPPAMLGALIAGILAFLLHTAIDLALFEGGPATTFFALVAVALAVRSMGRDAAPTPQARPPTAAPRRPALAIAVAVISMAVGVVALDRLVVRPARYQALLSAGRALTPLGDWTAYLNSSSGRAYVRALDAYRLDATAHVELVERLIPLVAVARHIDQAMTWVDEIGVRDPDQGQRFNLAGTLFLQRFELTGDRRALHDAIACYEAFVADYPTSPNRRLYLANALSRQVSAFQDDASRRRAIEHIEKALALEAQRVFVSTPNRMPPQQLHALRAGLRSLRDAGAATTTGPAAGAP